MGMTAGARVYSPEFVAELVTEVAENGDAESGAKIYQRAELTCVACHQLGGVGGIIGPSLDTVGAGLTPDLLIESVLWPQRQLKEGYFAVSVTTKGGDTWSGYREKEEEGTYFLRDTASGEVRKIPRPEISKLDNIGSLMPPGLTNGLSREELRDLIAYLATLKG
jgi:putative heme-binding domain-containing protein